MQLADCHPPIPTDALATLKTWVFFKKNPTSLSVSEYRHSKFELVLIFPRELREFRRSIELLPAE